MSRSSRAITSSRSNSRIRNCSGVSLVIPKLPLSSPALCNATQDLSDLGATSKLRLTSASVKFCSLNKRTASFLNSSVKIQRGIRFMKSPNKLIK